ncbi:unnamed protein product [Prunus armeniaca]
MEVDIASSAQRGDKYAAPSGNQKHAKIGVRHLIVNGMAFSSKCSFCIEDFVDKAERIPASRGLQGLLNNSPMERS